MTTTTTIVTTTTDRRAMAAALEARAAAEADPAKAARLWREAADTYVRAGQSIQDARRCWAKSGEIELTLSEHRFAVGDTVTVRYVGATGVIKEYSDVGQFRVDFPTGSRAWHYPREIKPATPDPDAERRFGAAVARERWATSREAMRPAETVGDVDPPDADDNESEEG